MNKKTYFPITLTICFLISSVNSCSNSYHVESTPLFYPTLTQYILTQTETQIPEYAYLKTFIPNSFDLTAGGFDNPFFETDPVLLFTSSPGISQWIDIEMISVSGTDSQNISYDASRYLEDQGLYTAPGFHSPVWSHDQGLYAFVFSSLESNSIILKHDITKPLEVISSSEFWFDDLAWSPDDKLISFTMGKVSGPTITWVCYLEITSVAQGSSLSDCLFNGKVNFDPSWSKVGTSIVFASGGVIPPSIGEQTDLFVWNIKTNSVVQITDTLVSEFAPKWSPDGLKFAYLERDNNNFTYSLWISDNDMNQKVRLGAEEDIYDFDWSPDGKKIVFTQLSPIVNEPCDIGCLPFTVLKILDLETGAITALTDGTQWIGDPSWRP